MSQAEPQMSATAPTGTPGSDHTETQLLAVDGLDEAIEKIRRATRQRDEARAELARLRAVVEAVQAVADEWADDCAIAAVVGCGTRLRRVLSSAPSTESDLTALARVVALADEWERRSIASATDCTDARMTPGEACSDLRAALAPVSSSGEAESGERVVLLKALPLVIEWLDANDEDGSTTADLLREWFHDLRSPRSVGAATEDYRRNEAAPMSPERRVRLMAHAPAPVPPGEAVGSHPGTALEWSARRHETPVPSGGQEDGEGVRLRPDEIERLDFNYQVGDGRWLFTEVEGIIAARLTARPVLSREALLLALARADGRSWGSLADATEDTAEVMYGKQVDAVLDVLDGARS